MVDKDYGGEGRIKKTGRNWQRILLPIVGLLMIVASGVVAFILSSPVGQWLRRNIGSIGSTDARSVQLAAGVGIFIIILLVYAAIYAAIVPKPPKGVSESELDKEKRERFEEEQRAKRRKREMKNKMKASRRE
jgi:hypothetical protein